MTTETTPQEVKIMVTETTPQVKIQVEYWESEHGRMSRTFHIRDKQNMEVILSQKEAIKMAKAILRIMRARN